MKKRKRIVFSVWVVFVLGILSVYFLNPQDFQAHNVKRIFSNNLVIGVGMYVIVGTFRGMTLLPSTPMVLAGMLAFPPTLLYVVNFICIFTSSTIVYYWSEYLEFGEYFHKRYPQQLGQLKHALQERELFVITFWGFFPAVPTDIICYVSGSLKIKLWKCLLGVAVGEGIICAIYIFGGGRVVDVLL